MDKQTVAEPEHLADDLIWGVKGDDGIAAFIGRTPTEVYYLIRQGKLPVQKIGRKTIVASRKQLRDVLRPTAA